MLDKANFDFDQIIPRRNTNCAKWDEMDEKYRSKELIHLGVADMDFQSPPAVRSALQKVVEHGVFGYTNLGEGFYSSIQRWMKKQFNCDIPKEWIVFCPRINIASSICVEKLTNPHDKIIINTPAYAPLENAVLKNHRTVVESPLLLKNGRYQMDFDQLEKIADESTKMFVLCNPHNPTGRIFDKEELWRLADFCDRHKLYLFSDEIHSDIIKKGHRHACTLSLPQQLQNRLIYANSVTKTMNIPGLIISYMIIPNEHLRTQISQDIERVGILNPNIFSIAALEAGYTQSDDWLEAVNDYIDQNEKLFRDFVEANMPKFHVLPREGTYLLWVDCKEIGLPQEKLEEWFLHSAKVSVYMGTIFGKRGEGYIRVNLATARPLLRQALLRMREVYGEIS